MPTPTSKGFQHYGMGFMQHKQAPGKQTQRCTDLPGYNQNVHGIVLKQANRLMMLISNQMSLDILLFVPSIRLSIDKKYVHECKPDKDDEKNQQGKWIFHDGTPFR